MILKCLGVILIVSASGGVGFKMAANHKKEEKCLLQLLTILDYIECELQYRLTPLPELCRLTAKEHPGLLSPIFTRLALEMEAQILPNQECCMSAALNSSKTIPPITKSVMFLLGKSIGRFDLDGQLKGLESVRQDCKRYLKELSNNRESRLRCYQTLGLCAGATLAILLI